MLGNSDITPPQINNNNDIIINIPEGISFDPKETKEKNTNISFELPLGTVLICAGMNLIFPTSSFILTPFAISQRSKDHIKVKITNRADT